MQVNYMLSGDCGFPSDKAGSTKLAINYNRLHKVVAKRHSMYVTPAPTIKP